MSCLHLNQATGTILPTALHREVIVMPRQLLDSFLEHRDSSSLESGPCFILSPSAIFFLVLPLNRHLCTYSDMRQLFAEVADQMLFDQMLSLFTAS